jgi:hypothetical protein
MLKEGYRRRKMHLYFFECKMKTLTMEKTNELLVWLVHWEIFASSLANFWWASFVMDSFAREPNYHNMPSEKSRTWPKYWLSYIPETSTL